MKRNAFALALSAAAVMLAAGCGGGDSGSSTLHVVSKQAHFSTVDLGPKGKSPGDIYAFDGPVIDPDSGDEIGQTYGTQTSISLGSNTEVVQAMITYTFDGGDSITLGGIGHYPRGDVGLVQNQSVDRPIVGGTGKYAGASGTVTSVRKTDGSYDHTFHLEG